MLNIKESIMNMLNEWLEDILTAVFKFLAEIGRASCRERV